MLEADGPYPKGGKDVGTIASAVDPMAMRKLRYMMSLRK
jgi:hypothetical protein